MLFNKENFHCLRNIKKYYFLSQIQERLLRFKRTKETCREGFARLQHCMKQFLRHNDLISSYIFQKFVIIDSI